MPIFRIGAVSAALVALAGCMEPQATRNAPTAISVTDAGLVIAGPPGFCIDPRASRSSRDQAFVLLGSCASISGEPFSPQPDLPVVLTATVAEGSLPSPAALDVFFRSTEGRTLLGGNGGADTVEVVATQSRGQVFLMHTRDAKGDQWRGLLPVRGRIVTVALRPAETRVPSTASLSALNAFALRILAANAGA